MSKSNTTNPLKAVYDCTKKALETFPGQYVILIPVKDDNEKIVLEILNRYNSGKPDKVAGLIEALEKIAKTKHPDRSCGIEALGFYALDCAVIGDPQSFSVYS